MSPPCHFLLLCSSQRCVCYFATINFVPVKYNGSVGVMIHQLHCSFKHCDGIFEIFKNKEKNVLKRGESTRFRRILHHCDMKIFVFLELQAQWPFDWWLKWNYRSQFFGVWLKIIFQTNLPNLLLVMVYRIGLQQALIMIKLIPSCSTAKGRSGLTPFHIKKIRYGVS